MNERIYLSNLQPDPEDPRDYIFEPDRDVILPESVNLLEHIGRRLNQLSRGTCTGQATGNIGEMFKPTVRPSPRFNYFTSRELLGPEFLVGDPGSTARMALRAGNKIGISREELCPYIEEEMNVRPKPEAYADAENYKIGEYRRIKFANIDDAIFQVRYALAKGWPVAIGLRVGEKLRDLPAGDLYGFLNSGNPYWGNHEMVIFGYGKTANGLPYFDIENSWGSDWCDNGCFKCLATVIGVDHIDLWVVQGFAGVDRVGVDQTIPKPAPVPPFVPEPPAPDPIQPEPQPTPQPEPTPPTPWPEKKSSGSGALIAAVLIALVLALAYSQA